MAQRKDVKMLIMKVLIEMDLTIKNGRTKHKEAGINLLICKYNGVFPKLTERR